MIQNWANDNAGFIELYGNLAAVGQRHLVIQNQIQQIAALQSLAEAQKRQQIENALLEERQNILYDISAALEDVKQLFKREPARAYYEFLTLEEFVKTLSLEHRMFPSLEWKSHCDKTVSGISELRAWCDNSLDAKSRNAGLGILEQRKLQIKARGEEASKKRKEEMLRVREESQRVQQQNFSKQARFLALATVICFTVSLITFLAIRLFHPVEMHTLDADDLMASIFFLGLLPIAAGATCCCFFVTTRKKLKIDDRKLVDRLTLVGLVIGIFSGLTLFRGNTWQFLVSYVKWLFE
jgi:hypothetical protein